MPYIGQIPATGENNSFKVLDDITSYTLTFNGSSASLVSVANDTITNNSHRFITGQRVTYNTTGTTITGLTAATAYFIIKEDQNTVKLATTYANAINNIAINFTALGTGSTHTLNIAFDGVNTKFKATYDNGTKAQITRAAQLTLSVNGVIQQPQDTASPTTGFGIDFDSVIIFSTAPISTDVFWGNLVANNFPTFDIADNTVDSFTGDGTTTSFTLSKEPANNQNLLVTLDGVVQYPSDAFVTRAYSVISNVITFQGAPGNATAIQVRHIGFAGATSSAVTGFYGRTGNVGLTTADTVSIGSLVVSGIVTAASFSGTATSTTNIPNLTGAITSVNTVTSLGSFTSANLATALSDETGSGANVFATSPVLVTPSLGIATAQSLVVSGISTLGITTATNLTAQSLVVSGITTVSAGTTALPSISPSGDSNTGVFFPSADTIAASTGGTARITIDSSGNITVTNNLIIPLGTSLLPSLAFLSDPNTGIYSPGADQLAVATNGTQKLIILSDGKTGIGASSPIFLTDILSGTPNTGANVNNPSQLSVTGPNKTLIGGGATFFVNSNSDFAIDNGGSIALSGRNTTSSTNSVVWGVVKGAKENATSTNTAGYLAFASQNHNAGALVEAMRIDSQQRLGIGTSSPGAQLQVNTGSAATIGQIIQLASSQTADVLKVVRSDTNNSLQFTPSGQLSFGDISSSPTTVITLGPSTSTNANIKVTANNTGNPNLLLQSMSGGGGGIGGPTSFVYFGDNNRALSYIGGTKTNSSASNASSDLVFGTTPDISTTAVTERARIDSIGRFGIGTISPTTGKLTLVSDIDPGTTAAGIAVSLSGVGGGTATSQYGIRVTGTGYTNSTNTYGVHSALTQAYVYPVFGGYFSASSYYSQGYGVYAETTCTNPVTAGASYAGYFKTNCSAAGTNYSNVGVRIENTATTGSLSMGLYVSTVSGPTTVIPFQVDHAGSERLRIHSSGGLLVNTSLTASVGGVGAQHAFFHGTSSQWVATVQHTTAAGNTPFGLAIKYTAATPNNASSDFVWCEDATAIRARIYSNGGLANYSANNANLSDRNAKKDISLAADTWNCVKEWEIVNYRYKDQPDDADLNLGVVAQQVAESCPEVITVFEEAKDDQPENLGVKEQQMYWMAIKALQEAIARIETLEASNADMLARLSALEGA